MKPTESTPTPVLATLPKPATAATLSDKVALALDEITRLETELEVLEAGLPPLHAKLEAAIRPLIAEIIALRKELIGIVHRQLDAASRRSSLQRDGADLVAHLAADLEERFGLDVRSLLERRDATDDDEEDSEDEDDSWARPENHAPHRAPPDPHRNPKGQPLDPEAAAKGIYRSLARELHPDKTRDESERVRRTELMQNLTHAWGERDLGELLKLLHAHGSPTAKADAMDTASLKACLVGLEATRDRLAKKARNMRHQGLPSGVVDWMPLLRDAKLFERLLRRHKAAPREELEALRHWKSLWIRPGGLEQFFREVPEEMWKQVV